MERIYRNAQRPYFDTPTWRILPLLVREEMSQSFLKSYFDRITEAVDSGTFDFDTDRHFSWKHLILDRLAWTTVVECLDEILMWIPELEEQSLKRDSDAQLLIPTIVGLAAFRVPSQG